MDKICKYENLKLTEEIKTLIVNNSNLDIRRLINMTEFLFNSKIDEKIKLDKVELLIDKFQAKNVYLNLC